jgi:hypothetical protein
VQLVKPESPRVARTARRIVLMFQFYKQNIDLNDETFLRFVSDYLEKNNVDADNTSYDELYAQIRIAIREFLHARVLGRSVPRHDG